MRKSRQIFVSAMAIAVLLAATPVLCAGALAPADQLIREAIVARIGGAADVTVLSLDVPVRPGVPAEFREAQPDPSARLGRPMRVALVTATGASVMAVATLRVVADQVVATRAIDRGEKVSQGDVRVVRGELRDVPLRRLLAVSQVHGGRALRPLVAGALVAPGAIAVRRAVEPGDRVTVVTLVGGAAVQATLVSADAGDPGDIVRVVNPETRRDVRGRVVKEGLVEVGDAR